MLRALALAALSGCTLLSNFEVTACEEDVQCDAALGGGYYCERGVCEPGCRNNRQCNARDPRKPLCSHAGGECSAISAPELTCYASSRYDDRTMGDATAQDLVLIGAFAPSLRSSAWLTLALAERELRDSRMPPAAAGGSTLMLVLCDDAPGAIQSSVAHLVDTLSARAILASFDAAVQPAALLSAGERAFLLSPDGALGSAPNSAYWHLGGDYGQLVPAHAALLRSLTRRLERRAEAAGRPTRIALVTSPGTGARLAALVSATLELGGEARERLEVLDRFRAFELSDDARERSSAELVAFAPDLVLLHASGVFGVAPRRERAEVVGLLEQAAAQAGLPPPLYVIGPRQSGDAYLDVLAAREPSFRARAVGLDIEPGGRGQEAALRARFAEAYGNLPSGAALGPAPRIYDALYYLSYAAAAAAGDGSEPSVSSLRSGLAQITDAAGPLVQLGGDGAGLELARELLLAGTPFDLRGVSGGGPIDPVRGLRAGSPVLSCWGTDGAPAVLGRFDGSAWTVESGLCAAEVVDGSLD